jgi:hypothetical protein
MKKDFSLIGLGICAWMAIISIAYTMRIILIDFFIIYNIRFTYIHLFYELIYNGLFIIGFYIFLKYLKDKKNTNYATIIRNFIICFVVTQVIQFFYTIEVGDYIIENYHDSWNSFYDFGGLYLNTFAYSIGEIFRYFAIGILLYTFYKNGN